MIKGTTQAPTWTPLNEQNREESGRTDVKTTERRGPGARRRTGDRITLNPPGGRWSNGGKLYGNEQRVDLSDLLSRIENDDRRWTIMPVDPEFRANPATTAAQEFFQAIADLFGNLEAFTDALADFYGGELANVMPGIDCGHCEVSPADLGAMLRAAGIVDFTQGMKIVDAVRELFETVRGDATPEPNEGLSDFLSDPSLSLEAKLMLLMAKMAEDLDEQIEDKMKQLDSSSAKDGAKKTGQSQQSNTQRLQTELEDLVNRRRQMFASVQNMMKSLHETSMGAIRNMK